MADTANVWEFPPLYDLWEQDLPDKSNYYAGNGQQLWEGDEEWQLPVPQASPERYPLLVTNTSSDLVSITTGPFLCPTAWTHQQCRAQLYRGSRL